jgi:tRNA (guanine37-N1)-methyltransferase
VLESRDFTQDIHKRVDDRPYGGGPGMVMQYQPLHDAITAARNASTEKNNRDLFIPAGKPITQHGVKTLSCTLKRFI